MSYHEDFDKALERRERRLDESDERKAQGDCGAIYTTNPLGGMDICARPAGHDGRHDWRQEGQVR